ncbi:MAG: hypothetical protein QM811_26280 [Pirellulales bacterium]
MFDDDDLRHGNGGKVAMNYKHPDLSPTAADNREFRVDGDKLSLRNWSPRCTC